MTGMKFGLRTIAFAAASYGNTIFSITIFKGIFSIDADAKRKTPEFIHLLSDLTEWSYEPDSWVWNNFSLRSFEKAIFQKKGRISNRGFDSIIEKNPLSYAITGNQRIEHTNLPS